MRGRHTWHRCGPVGGACRDHLVDGDPSRSICQGTHPLRFAGRDFVAIEKPLTAIWIAIDAHEAGIKRHTKYLDHRPDPAHERWKRPFPMPNVYPIPDVEFSPLWPRCCSAHWLLPFVLPNIAVTPRHA